MGDGAYYIVVRNQCLEGAGEVLAPPRISRKLILGTRGERAVVTQVDLIDVVGI